MAKKDFIVKDDPSLIEKENRTTIIGIIAIVAIVVVVASMMKVQEVGFFSIDDERVVGLAAETFVGVRHVALEQSEVLVAHVSTNNLQRSYYAYLQEQMLVVMQPDGYRQAVLQPRAASLLVGSYVDGARDVEVVVNEGTNQFILNGLTDPNLPALSGVKRIAYNGNIRVAGTEYSFRVFGDQAIVSTGDIIELSPRSDGTLGGMWDEREVIYNPQRPVLIIHDFY